MKKRIFQIFITIILHRISGKCLLDNITKVEIDGNIRLDDATIFSYININANSILSKGDLNILFKDLFATELFSEIKF